MIRIAMPWIIDVAEKLGRLREINESTGNSKIIVRSIHLMLALDRIFDDSAYAPYIRQSYEKGRILLAEIETLLENFGPGYESLKIPSETIFSIRSKADAFSTLFMAELGTLPCFLATAKGSHDIALLTEQGEALFPKATAQKVPATLSDMRDAGKALGFGLYTACGMHGFRVLEAVLHRYWDTCSGGKARPSGGTIAAYMDEMKKQKLGDPKVWETLKLFRHLHRNPLRHPEVTLTEEDALNLVGTARAAIWAMLNDMPEAESAKADPPM